MMKFLLLALFAIVVTAEDYSKPEWTVDLSSAVSIEEIPGFWDDKYELPKWAFKHDERSRRIVNGVVTIPGDHPYQASILMQFPTGTGLCGGSMISLFSTLTAAHCPISSSSTLVIMGAHNRLMIEPTQQRQTVFSSNYRIHPQYNPANLNNDIAILIAPSMWLPSLYIGVINMPFNHMEQTFAGFVGTSTGWGRTTNGGQVSDVLRRARNNIITVAACANVFGTSVANSAVICIETAQSNQGTCLGDSGGVLSVNEPQFGLIQVGVTTFVAGAGCVAGFPSGAARITSFRDWIQANVQ